MVQEMNRGGGRRVDKALDSPRTSKGCIMRSSPLSCLFPFLFFSEPSQTAHPTHCRCCKCVCVNDRVLGSFVSHSRGYFGLQWVEFRWCILWLKHIPSTHNILSPTGDVCCMMSPVQFCYCLPFVFRTNPPKCVLSMIFEIGKCVFSSDFPCLNTALPSEPLLFPQLHPRTHTRALLRSMTDCCAYMLAPGVDTY